MTQPTRQLFKILAVLLMLGVTFGTQRVLKAGDLVLVRDGRSPVPIIIPQEASPALQDAADDLAHHLFLISGAKPKVSQGVPQPMPDAAIWVGYQPVLLGLLPGIDLELHKPEEILFASNSQHLAILGRDRFDARGQIEFGTPNAVYTFLEKHLHVRWLWPGELGTDIQRRSTISIAPMNERFAPIFRDRTFRFPRSPDVNEPNRRWWDHHQRSRGSLTSNAQHAFANWWELYHQTHPQYFAQQADGTRGLGGLSAHSAKLCVSNPAVAEQWLEQTQRLLLANPQITMIGASPNDGSGWCECANCMAWDHPDAPMDDRGRKSLTERYVKFWNRLTRGLKQRYPDRDLIVDVMAYSRYMAPPVATTLEDNIAVSYVGNFPIGSQKDRIERKEHWLAWSRHASMLRYRPNMFWYDGGVWGLPSIAIQRTIEDFRFLAEQRCVGLDIDSIMLNWSTHGPQLYLIAQLAYNPMADGKAVLADYYQRGFGPAADAVERYFNLWDIAHKRVVDDPSFRSGGNQRYSVLELLQREYTPELLDQAQAILDEAKAAASQGSQTHRKRVEFIESGLAFTRLQLQIMQAMANLRTSRDHEALQQAMKLCNQRDAFFKNAPPQAIDGVRIMSQITRRGMRDHLGPPSETLMDTQAAVKLKPAKWHLAFSDSFDRAELGPNWKVREGAWEIADKALLFNGEGGVIEIDQDFPGLHRLVMEVTPLVPEGLSAQQPEAADRISDLSAFIQSDGGHRGGYFLQFGGAFNKRNAIRRLARQVASQREHRIEPGKRHRIVAEFDGQKVRLHVNDEPILSLEEARPLIGESHDRVGIYLFTPALIHSVQVFTSPAVVIGQDVPAGGTILDDPDAE